MSIRRYGGAGVLCLLLGLFGEVPQRRGWAAALVVGTFIMNPPLVYLFEVWPFSGLRYGYGWNAIVPFFAGCLAAAGVARLRRAESDATPWLAPAVCLAVAALALRTGHRLGAAAAVACAAATWLPVRRRGGWVVPIVLVGLHAGVVLNSIGTGLRPAPDPARVATRIPVLRRAQEQLGGRLLGGPEVRTGVLLTEHLPSAGGYEPGNPPGRVERLTRVLGLEFLPTGAEVRRGTWSKIAANPGIAAALGIGLIAVPQLEATPLRVAGYESLLTLPDGDLLLYRPAAPRFQVLGRIVRAADEEESFRLVTSPGFDATAAVVLEEDPPLPILSADGSRGAVRVLSDAPERIELRATLTSPGVLVIADTYFPGWQARVDGALAPLLRANYAFRAVALESGQHDVVLVYAPRSFRVGVALSIAGLALTAGLWLVVRRRAARGVPPSPDQFA